MKNTPPTQEDIAKIVGVSQRAVATVVGTGNANCNVSEEKRRRIIEVAQKLGYRPHRNAQLFRGVKSGLIGFFKPVSMLEHRVNLTLSLGEKINNAGYRLVSLDVIQEGSGVEQELEFLYDSQVEGLIVSHFSHHVTQLPIFDLFCRRGIPTVILEKLDEDSKQPSLPAVYADHYQGGAELTRFLVEQGCRSIAMVVKAGRDAAFIDKPHRIQGYKDIMAEAGLKTDVVGVETMEGESWMEANFDAGRRGMQILLQRPRLPEAVCFHNDLLAYAGINECRERGVRIPDDLKVAGFDDQSIGHFSVPPITSVAQPMEEIAGRAVELLMSLIGDRKQPERVPQIALPCTLKPRLSTGN